MKVALVSILDPRDVASWSGTFFHMGKALEADGHDVVYVGPLDLRGLRGSSLRAVSVAWNRTPFPKVELQFSASAARLWSGMAADRLPGDIDFVLSPWTYPAAYLRVDLPIVLWPDSTTASLENFHPWVMGLSRTAVKGGRGLDELALRRCALAAFSSQWAAESARCDYGVSSEKLRVIPFGANIEPDERPVVLRTISARSFEKIRLVHISTDWQIKGSDIAVEIARAVRESGLAVELTIIGDSRSLDDAPFVRCVGRISKATPEGRERLLAELRQAHFLLQPSRTECFGISVCEAYSMGVPALCTAVGGMAELVEQDVTGALVPAGAALERLPGFIRAAAGDRLWYERMAANARQAFEGRLNWNASVRSLIAEVRALAHGAWPATARRPAGRR